MANIKRIPFTEIFERCQVELVRDGSSSESKFKGRVNDVYTVDIPSQIDWRHIRKDAAIATINDYTTGYISTTSGTAITGSDTVWTSANSNNMLLKVSGYDELYRVTYYSATGLVADRSWVGIDISTDTGYVLYQDRYTLSSDFDRLILDPDKSVYYWNSGNKVYLKYRSPDVFEQKQTSLPNTPSYYTIKWVEGDPFIFIDAPDNTSRTITYTYMPLLTRLSEYTTGTIVTLANAGTAITGSGTAFTGFVTDTSAYDYYFRLDRDGTGSNSKWYKIASAGSATGLTLSDAYAGLSVSSGSLTYTISMVSLLPPGLDLAIIYGTALVSASDQNNTTQFKDWAALYEKILSQYKTIEGKLGYGLNRMHTIYEKSGARR